MRRAQFDHSTAGDGHVIRCNALRDELRARGWGWKAAVPDVFVLDVGGLHFWTDPAKCVVIDDFPHPHRCDLIVNGTLGADAEAYRGLRALVGPAYALLRSAFTKRHNSTELRTGALDIRTMTGLDADQAASRLAGAEIAITYGGMRCIESACVGTAMVVVAQTDETPGQRSNRDALVAAGAAVSASESSAADTAAALLRDPDLLGRMGMAARALVDGRGCERVADAIEALF